MSTVNDYPITEEKYSFGFKNYIENLEKIIREDLKSMNDSKSLVIGLHAEWGSGKTHLLEGIEACVTYRNQLLKLGLKNFDYQLALWRDSTFKTSIFNWEIKNNEIIVPIIFNAWRFEKEEHLIIPLLKSLYWKLDKLACIEEKKLDKQNKETSTLKKVSKNIFQLAKLSFFPIIESIEEIEIFGTKIKNPTQQIREAIKKYHEEQEKNQKDTIDKLQERPEYESIYFDMVNQIADISDKHRLKFLFLIDDIDRCLPENSLKMLETMKLFLDIPNCAFVMAIDKEVLELAIKYRYKEYTKDGSRLPITASEYMEKIVTLPFSFPMLQPSQVKSFIRLKYEEIIKEIPDEELVDIIFKTVPANPRKIIRTLDLLKLKSIQSNCIVDDKITKILLLKAMIELFIPQLDREIKHDLERGVTIDKNILKAFCNQESCIQNIEKCLDEEALPNRVKNILKEYQNSRNDFSLSHFVDVVLSEEDLLENVLEKVYG